MIRTMGKNGWLLMLFGIASTGLVSLTHQLTKSHIAHAAELNQQQILNQVVPAALHDNDLFAACVELTSEQYLGNDKPHRAFIAKQQGQPTGIAIETTAPGGYAGSIELIVGIQLNGEITGVQVLSHQETPGLGDKIEKRKTNWVDSFIGQLLEDEKDPAWAVKKDGGQFDQFTGATITPRAVVGAVKNTLIFYNRNQSMIYNQAAPCEAKS